MHKPYKVRILTHTPVWPICHSTSACRIWATWRGMALSRRRLEWRPVACQNPEPRDRLVRLRGRDDCHDCHFCVQRVSLQGEPASLPTEPKETIVKEIQFLFVSDKFHSKSSYFEHLYFIGPCGDQFICENYFLFS